MESQRPAEDEPNARPRKRDAVVGIVLVAVGAMLLWPILIGLYIYFFH